MMPSSTVDLCCLNCHSAVNPEMDTSSIAMSSNNSNVCCFWMLYVQVAILFHNNVGNSGTLVHLVSIHTH